MTTTPSGSLLYRHSSPDREPGGRPEWVPVGQAPSESLCVLAAADGAIHLFSPDAAGVVCHQSWPGDGEATADGRWERLGGSVSGPVRAVVVGEAIALVARGRDGTLQYERLDDRRRADVSDGWDDLGHCPGGSVDFVAARDTVHIFVSDERGRVSHKARSSDRWLPSQRDWADLGGGFGGPVVAAADEDGNAAVVAFSEGGELRAREWRDGDWDSEGDAWKPVEIADARSPVMTLA